MSSFQVLKKYINSKGGSPKGFLYDDGDNFIMEYFAFGVVTKKEEFINPIIEIYEEKCYLSFSELIEDISRAYEYRKYASLYRHSIRNPVRTYITCTLLTTTKLIKNFKEETDESLKEFHKFEKDILERLDENDQYRLCQWLSFFNFNYSKCVCAYEAIVGRLIFSACFELQAELRQQTDYEFAISRSFWDKLFQSKLDLSIKENDESAGYLLTTSFILGKYSGMQIRSTFEAFEKLSNGINENSLNEMFAHLFTRYELPKFLTSNLSYMNLNEVEVLMYLLQGNTIRKYPKLPLSISKKETFALMNNDNPLLTSNLLMNIILAKLTIKVKNKDVDLLHSIVINYGRYLRRIPDSTEDIDFWADVINWIYAPNSPLSEINWRFGERSPINDLLDYLVYMRYESGNADFSLKGRTLKSITRAMEEWHENAHFGNSEKWKELSWQGSEVKEYNIEFNDEKYLLEELTSGEELYKESEAMKHCVFTYAGRCASNHSRIWSMQKEVNDTYEKYLTIELQQNEIMQVKGKHNAPPSEEDLQVIEKWEAERKLSLSLCDRNEEMVELMENEKL